jgi:hypothetical protein
MCLLVDIWGRMVMESDRCRGREEAEKEGREAALAVARGVA